MIPGRSYEACRKQVITMCKLITAVTDFKVEDAYGNKELSSDNDR